MAGGQVALAPVEKGVPAEPVVLGGEFEGQKVGDFVGDFLGPALPHSQIFFYL